MMFRRYPEYMKTAMWCGLLLYFICLFCSSFATQVSIVHLCTMHKLPHKSCIGLAAHPPARCWPRFERRGRVPAHDDPAAAMVLETPWSGRRDHIRRNRCWRYVRTVLGCEDGTKLNWVPGFVFPFMLNAMLNNLGLRWTLRIWAIMTCTATGIAFLGIRPRVPISKPHPGQRRPRLIVPQMVFFKSPLFLSFVSTHETY